MEVTMFRLDWQKLLLLARSIRAGSKTGNVKDAERLIMRAFADAIEAEVQRSEVTGEKLDGLFDLSIEIHARPNEFFGEEKRGRKRTVDEFLDLVDEPKIPRTPVQEQDGGKKPPSDLIEW